MRYNSQQKLADNIAAIRIALEWRPGDFLSPEEAAVLKRYAGFGGLKAVLFPRGPMEEWQQLNASKEDLKLHPQMMELHDLLYDTLGAAEYKSVMDHVKNSILTAFYTPDFIPQTLFSVLKEQGIEIKTLYEPSAGAGVFVNASVEAFPMLDKIVAVEKDMITGGILEAAMSILPVPIDVHPKGFEEMPQHENGTFDCIASNIPFGNFAVFDDNLSFHPATEKIHNYFFVKGLDKLRDGGLLAFLTTDSFLNSPSNEVVRQHVLSQADFISVNVLPDNLMKDTANTEAPSHLLLLQKNTGKEKLSLDEQLLVQSVELKNEYGSYFTNAYINQHPELILGDRITPGQNQYGKATLSVWQEADITGIASALAESLTAGIQQRFDDRLYDLHIGVPILPAIAPARQLTYLPMPETVADGSVQQLGLFDVSPALNSNRAAAYIKRADEDIVDKKTARILAVIKTEDNPNHESMVLIAAKAFHFKGFVYKLYSNLQEVEANVHWMVPSSMEHQLSGITQQLQGFNHKYFTEGEGSSLINLNQKETIAELKEINPYHKEGTLIIYGDQVGFVSYAAGEKENPVFIPALQDKKDIGFYQEYTVMRDVYLSLTDKETEENIAYPDLRKRLNALYDSLTEGYGILNSTVNRQRILKDEAFGFVVLASLERKEGEQYFKADILTESLVENKVAFRTDDPLEALARSLNDKGNVDIHFIANATGLSVQETVTALTDHIYLNPVNREWQTADQLLSGNVVSMLSIAQSELEKTPGDLQLQKSLDALQKVQPEKIPFELLDFNLGERWIPLDYYNRFASQLFELDTEVNYFSSVDTFKVKTARHNAKTLTEYAVQTRNGNTSYGETILEHALENTTPFYTYEIERGDKKIRVPDNEAIQLAHQKIESIRENFTRWLGELSPADKKDIEERYNNTFNCYVLREYDGSHLQFPGLDRKKLGIEDLYSSQKNSVWRIVQNRGALIDHEVGLGKTLTMIVAAHEMKRLGIVQKPMILALKANVNQIRDTYRKAYPAARILAPGENDFTPDKRIRLFHEIKNNNWDCIILTHDQFGKIPQSPDIQKQIFEKELDNVEADLLTIKTMGGEISRRMLKGLEIRKGNLAVKLQGIAADIAAKKDAGINFRTLGVDHLFVDESHKYKNLTFTTRHDRVAGLGNMAGSQKALNMLFAVRELQNKFDSDLCVTFLSGTPISNSLTEMYLLFKYLRPREMERQQIENFDGWAAVFAKKTVDFEFSVTNEIIAKERFRHFIKVPELALFYNEITDYKTAKHINLDKPELQEQLVNIKPTPDQEEFIKNLMAFAKTGNASYIGRAQLTPEEDKGRMLIATNYAKKMSADMRLIDPYKYEDHPNHKVNVCAAKVAELYRQSFNHKGTQIVFSDIGTPKPNEFNLYDALKTRLVERHNISAEHISFIHDWTDRSRPELFRKMNAGEIRILLGSTEKAGTGLNVQSKIVAMHHLDIPWKPSELEQRNGRGARQGNLLAKSDYDNKVQNFIYAVEQSLDNYKFNLLKNKQTFISQMKNCSLNVRTIDEGSVDEKSGMNFSEYIAILSGDTTLLEKSKLEKKVAVLESLRSAHHKETVRSRYQLEHVQNESASTGETLGKLTIDAGDYKSRLQYEKEGAKANPIQLSHLQSADAEAIGMYLMKLVNSWRPAEASSDHAVIGKLYGFDCCIHRQSEMLEENGHVGYRYYNSYYVESPKTALKYTWNQGHISGDNPKIATRHFLNAIDRVEGMQEKYTKNLKELEQHIPQLEKLIAKPFEKENELAELKKSVASLEREIAINIQKKQMLVSDGDSGVAAAKAPVVNIDEAEEKTPKKKRKLRV